MRYGTLVAAVAVAFACSSPPKAKPEGGIAAESEPPIDARGPAKSAKRTLLILGGTSFLGPYLVEEAKTRGYEITLFNRGKSKAGMFPELETLIGDRKSDVSALEGRKWDVVLDTTSYNSQQVRLSSAVLAGNVGHYVMVSTAGIYKVPFDAGIDESHPKDTWKDPNFVREGWNWLGYVRGKATAEDALLEAMADRVTIIRPTIITGPGDNLGMFLYWLDRVKRGGSTLAPGDGDDQIQLIDVRDLARFMLDCADNKQVGTFNAATATTWKEFLGAAKQALGSDSDFIWIDDTKFLVEKVYGKDTPSKDPENGEALPDEVAAFWKMMVGGYMTRVPLYLPRTGVTRGFNYLSMENARAAGMKVRPLEETIRDTVAWFDALPPEERAKVLAGKGVTAAEEAAVLGQWAKKSKARSKAKAK